MAFAKAFSAPINTIVKSIITTEQIIIDRTGLVNNGWEQVVVCFSPNPGTAYDVLYMYPEMFDPAPVQYRVLLSDFELIVVQDPNLTSSNYQECVSEDWQTGVTCTVWGGELNWIDQFGQVAATGSPVTLSPGNYTFAHQYPNADVWIDCSPALEEDIFISGNVCHGSGQLVFSDMTDADFTAANHNPLLGAAGSVQITGTITVNGTLTFAGADVTMCEGAKIVLGPNGVFNVHSQTTIRGCDKLWDRIVAESSGTNNAVVDVNYSTIRDAKIAVAVANGGVVNLKNSTLTNNWVGLRIKDYAGTYTGQIYGSTIWNDANLIYQPTPSSPPIKIAYRGIVVDNVESITIGHSAYSPNIFKQFNDAAIFIVESEAFIYNNEFDNTELYAQGIGLGTGVFLRGPATGFMEVFVGGTGVNEGNTFDNFYESTGSALNRGTAVYAEDNVVLHCINNDFSECRISVGFTNCEEQVFIIDNDVMNVNYGEYAFWGRNNLSVDLIKIDDNDITMRADAKAAVRVEEAVASTTQYTRIASNTISGSEDAIYTLKQNELYIYNNAISFDIDYNPISFGIHVVETGGLGLITDNSVSNNNINRRWFMGIGINESPNTELCSNSVNYLRRGIWFNQNCSPSTITLNKMTNCKYGFYMTNGAEVGAQGVSSFAHDNE